MRLKLICLLLIIILLTLPASAQVKLDTLLTTEGLNKSGNPVTVKREFSFTEEQGVQYYVKWNSDNQQHDVAVRWFGPQDKLINFLYLANFSENIVRDYISFEQETATQYFIPQERGEYSIQLYLDQQLVAISNFIIK
ncbi:hypothetical protein [Halanaerobacter jeridensis]|uniref:Uncharacterized protein n=1 Tax=Halanaerobacter jeridensis TaxID=706427 RepID=A0A938XQR9_9FIRM|nr:hypothetical protein [Halanaerobacter jeridensis]MBM7557772.1 hypothetical protein [Halanaerobacter jeridensis]